MGFYYASLSHNKILGDYCFPVNFHIVNATSYIWQCSLKSHWVTYIMSFFVWYWCLALLCAGAQF